jgi:hypothetical protein
MIFMDLVYNRFIFLFALHEKIRKDRPVNRPLRIGGNNDLLLRELDCAVIENLHFFRDQMAIQPFDSIRGYFQKAKNCMKMPALKKKTTFRSVSEIPIASKGIFVQ